MNLDIAEKLQVMRESERITSRSKAAEIIGIPHNALWRYEKGEAVPKGDVLMKILSTPIFEKYALWFTTGKIAPEAGQIAPALAHYGQDSAESAPSKRNVG